MLQYIALSTFNKVSETLTNGLYKHYMADLSTQLVNKDCFVPISVDLDR